MLKNKIKAFFVLAFVLAISLSLFGLSLDKPCAFVFAEGETPLSEESTTEKITEAKAVAKIGETEYKTLAEAVAAAQAGETVTLVADTAENVVVNKDLTIDLGDYTLSSGDKDVVFTVEKGNVIINAGKGSIRGGSGSDNIAIKVTEGNLTINGGNYYVGGDEKGLGNSTVYIAGSGTVTINGGMFETEKSWKDFYYVLNIQNNKTGTFVVSGGTFVNYDPMVGDDNRHGNFVAAGFYSIKEGNVYTVSKTKPVAQIGTDNYASLKTAFEGAKKGDTVTMIADYNVEKIEDTVESQNIVSVDMTLDLNGHKITFFAEMSEYKNNHVAIYVKNGATFTVTDSSAGGTGGIISTLDKSSKPGDNIGPYTFDVVDNSNLIINGGYYLGGGTVAQVETGKVTVNGGVFEINPYGKPYCYDFMFNCIDSAYIDGTATIEVNGGTFKNWDPFNSAGDIKEGVNARFTMEGVGVTKNSDGDYVATSGKVAQVVDVNGDSVAAYATLAEAVAAAKKGETVTLVADTAENVVVNKNLKIDLGDYTLSSGDKDIVFTVEKGNVIINADKGGIRGGSGSNNVAIKVTEGNLTINGGNYYVGGDKSGLGNSTVYILGSGNVTINGGMFETEKSWKDFYYVLNIQNGCAGTFTVCGGTFVNYDPTVGDDNMHGNFVTAGHKAFSEVKEEKKYYTVKSYQVAKIGDNVYDSLKEAVAAAKKGDTITLCSDYYDYSEVDAHIVYNIAGITLDLNGYTYISENFGHVFEGTDGVITNGKMVCNKGSSYALFVGDEGETIGFTVKDVEFEGGINVYNASGVVLENCTVRGTNYYAVWLDEGASVIIKSGTYTAGEEANVNGAKGSVLAIEGGIFNTNGEVKFLGTSGCTLTVSGGTFVGNEPNLAKDNFAKGFTLVKNNDGTYGVVEYSTLKEYLVNLGTSITLKIGVKEVGKNVKVTYAYNGGEEVVAEKVNGYYIIAGITPQIIDRVYTVKVYEGEAVVDSKELSVLGYCDTLLKTASATEKAKAAVKALVYYGKAAKEFLRIADTTAIDEVIEKHSLTEIKLAKPTSGATSTGKNLISKVTLNVSDVNAIVYAMTAENYATVYGENSGYTVTIGGENISADKWTKDGDLYVYLGTGIYASELGKRVEVVIKKTIGDNTETVQTLVYGVYDYCANKWEADGVSGIAKAIYAYGVACAEYIAK